MAEEVKMLFSRSKGRKVEPPQDTMVKALETFTLVTPQKRTCSKETKLASGCIDVDVDVKGSIMASGGAS